MGIYHTFWTSENKGEWDTLYDKIKDMGVYEIPMLSFVVQIEIFWNVALIWVNASKI